MSSNNFHNWVFLLLPVTDGTTRKPWKGYTMGSILLFIVGMREIKDRGIGKSSEQKGKKAEDWQGPGLFLLQDFRSGQEKWKKMAENSKGNREAGVGSAVRSLLVL